MIKKFVFICVKAMKSHIRNISFKKVTIEGSLKSVIQDVID